MSHPPSTDDAFVADLLARLCHAPRPTGSARNAAVATELQEVYASLGYAVEVNAHPFTGWEQDADPVVELSAAGEHRVADRPMPVVWAGGSAGDVVGRIIAGAARPPPVVTFGAYPWDVLPVVDGGGREAARLLTGDPVWPQPLEGPSDLPHAMLRPADARWIARHLAAGRNVTVRLRVSCRLVPDQTLRNVLARRPGDAWPPRVLVSAHYDSFVGSPGAHDNASGTAAMAVVARRLAGVPGVGFAAFDAEEWDKLGAERHTAALERAGTLAGVRLVVNVDSVGVGEHLYVMASPAWGERVARALGALPGSLLTSVVRLPSGLRVAIAEEAEFRQFDTWSFMRRGVPVVQIGAFGPAPFTEWHQPGDRLERIGAEGRRLIADVVGVVEALVRATV